MSANDGKRIQSNDSMETYVYGTNNEIIHTHKKKIRCINILKHYKKLLTIALLQKETVARLIFKFRNIFFSFLFLLVSN